MDTTRKVPVIRKSLKPARPLHRLSAEIDSAVCVDYLPPLLHQNEVSWSEENWTISSGYAQRETKWSDVPTFRSKQDLKGQERPIERRHSGQGDGTKKEREVVWKWTGFMFCLPKDGYQSSWNCWLINSCKSSPELTWKVLIFCLIFLNISTGLLDLYGKNSSNFTQQLEDFLFSVMRFMINFF
ncbi:uncharacterized protein C8orf88 homolog isoform X2 [Heterodontus francisci]